MSEVRMDRREPVNETTYLAAVRAVSSDGAQRHSWDPVAEHLRAAEVLSDLAEARLAERGIFWASRGFEDAYLAEVVDVGRQFAVPYYARGA
jgi:hypothetical protein